ncbi:DUF7097 family protein [Halorhabdus amylolytica]|uniref:DUF7097 family protein n=1 Tax=Halorhabdus amylolytica TaxID=2559573 RepID=UPI0010AAF531|nr:hypothetical protein [Halorhabdus amylolytica]
MEKTDAGTTVGVEDPDAYVERCDHCTDEGRCRFAVEHGDRDRDFADKLSATDFRCPVVGDPEETGLTGPWDWVDCPHMRARNRQRKCVRCGLEERRSAHTDDRPLLEEHHLSYADDEPDHADGPTPTASDGTDTQVSHEITVYLCRWCHAKVHDSWASLDDPASPDPEALAAKERRRSREQAELDFESAAERHENG